MSSLKMLLAGLLALAATSGVVVATPLALLPADALVIESIGPDPTRTAQARTLAKALSSRIAAGDAAQALAQLDETTDVLSFEITASELIDVLQAGRDSAAVRQALVSLTQTPARVYRRHEETRSHWYVPVFDVAGKAGFALTVLDARKRREYWSASLATAPTQALKALQEAGELERIAAAESIATLEHEPLQALKHAMLSRPESAPSGLWRALAERSGEPEVFTATLARCSESDLLGLLPATARLDDEASSGWLIALGQRPGFTSASLLALAPRAAAGSMARAHLLQMLDSKEHAASAGAALAALPQDDLLDLLAQLVAEPEASPSRLQALALAARLHGSAASAAAARDLAGHPQMPAVTREELLR